MISPALRSAAVVGTPQHGPRAADRERLPGRRERLRCEAARSDD